MKISNNKAISVIEYAVMFIIVLSAFLIMGSYIKRGVSGYWGKTGQTFGMGRQYDSQKTVDCTFDEISNTWYDQACMDYYRAQNGCGDQAVGCIENIIINGSCSSSQCNSLTGTQ